MKINYQKLQDFQIHTNLVGMKHLTFNSSYSQLLGKKKLDLLLDTHSMAVAIPLPYCGETYSCIPNR